MWATVTRRAHMICIIWYCQRSFSSEDKYKKNHQRRVFFENIVSFSLSMKVSLIILEEKKSRKHEKSEKCSKTFHVHSCVWSLPVEEWCSAVKPEIKPNLQYGFFCHLQFTEAWERLRWPKAAGGQETRFCFLRRVSPHTGPGAAGLHHWSSQSPATERATQQLLKLCFQLYVAL